MKITIFAIYLLSFASSVYAASKNYGESVVTDPSIRRRCQGLIDQRVEKIEIKQKLSTLLSKNEKLMSKTPPHKKKIRQKLEKNYKGLQKEQALILERISNIEETIVRRGCPGIAL